MNDVAAPARLAAGFRLIQAAGRLSARLKPEDVRRNPGPARAALKRFIGFHHPVPSPGTTVRRIADIGPIEVLTVTPDALGGAGAGAIIYVHGGGLVFHDVETFLPTLTRLASESGRTIIALGYPKAPEHPPRAIVDAVVAAVRNLIGTELARIGILPSLAGDSIGGLMVLNAALRLDLNARPSLVLIYPVLDLREGRCFDSRTRYARGYLLDADFMAFYRDLASTAFPDGFDPLDLSAHDIARLGPIRIVSAQCDVLADEARLFARRAAANGPLIHHQEIPSLPHDFLLFAGRVPEAAAALGCVAGALRFH